MASSYSPDHSLEREISFLGVSLIECGRPEEMATIKKKKKELNLQQPKLIHNQLGVSGISLPAAFLGRKRRKS